MRALSLVFTVVLATACGGSSPTGGGGNPPPGASVNMLEYQFSPETLRVAAGTIVQWSNGGTTDHTSTSDASGWDSGALAPPHAPNSCPYPPCGDVPGATFQFRFVNAGTYPYHCSFHSALGMKGVVIVSP